jgi:hypothetical protein
MKAPAAAALLRERHGEANARKIALTEQRRAKRARSRRRFAFWADVAARIILSEHPDRQENLKVDGEAAAPPARSGRERQREGDRVGEIANDQRESACHPS